MSADALRRIGLGNGWAPESWHLKFADQLRSRMGEQRAAMVVFGIFGTAMLRDGIEGLGEFGGEKYVVLQNATKHELAKEYLPDLAKALGLVVHVTRRPVFKRGLKATSEMGDPEFARECRSRIERMMAKSYNKGVQM